MADPGSWTDAIYRRRHGRLTTAASHLPDDWLVHLHLRLPVWVDRRTGWSFWLDAAYRRHRRQLWVLRPVSRPTRR